MEEQLDLFAPKTYQTYFDLYLAESETDAHGVMTSRVARDFPKVEARVRMIDDQGQVSVIVPFVASVKRIKVYRAKNGRL